MPRVRIEMNSRPAFVIHTYGRRDAIISAAIAKYGSWDSASTEIIRKLLEHDADFVDIGANIGWFTLVAAHSLGRRGRVHSFEPDPRHVAKIRAAVRKSNFDNVIVNAWALADRAGEERLYRSETNFGDHRLFDLDEPRRSVKVAVKTLDEYTQIDATRPLVIKLDTQGSEARILNGAQRTLTTHRAEIVLLCEAAPRLLSAAGSSLDELVARLRALGFLAALVDHQRAMLQPITWERFVRQAMDGSAAQPNYESDLLLFRRPDGLVAPVLKFGRE